MPSSTSGRRRTYSLVGVTSGALGAARRRRAGFILGHELGHFLFGNNRLDGLLSARPGQRRPDGAAAARREPVPALAEEGGDQRRSGRPARGRDFSASATALLKATFGLSEKNLNLDIEALLDQVDEIKGHPELMEEAFASHPLLPIRLKALDLFSRSEKAARHGFPVQGPALPRQELEDLVDELVRLTRRYPFRPVDRAIMRVVALGGALLLAADSDISDDEVKILVQILHGYFTDEPELEIVTDPAIAAERLPGAIALLNADGDATAKNFVLSRLTDIALADGALMDAESSVILDLAHQMGLPSRVAYAVVVGAAQAVGFRSDVKLNRMSEEVRRGLQSGFARGNLPQAPLPKTPEPEKAGVER